MTPLRVLRASTLAALIPLLVGGCRACSESPPAPPAASPRVPEPPRRWAKPPTGQVRAYPPHAIRADGVGPYLLGAPLSDVLREVPEGPHIELLQLGRLANWRIVRAEQGQLLVGADARNRVGFVAVLGQEIARTQSGAGVGQTGAELTKAMGRERDAGDVARDRRIYEFEALPGVRFVTDAPADAPPARTRVIAVVVLRPDLTGADQRRSDRRTAARDLGERRAACRDGGELAAVAPELLAASRPRTVTRPGATPARAPSVRFGCFTGGSPEALVALGDDVTIVGGEPGRLRRYSAPAVEGLDFVAPLDIDRDGRDEVVYGLQRRTAGERAVDLRLLRWEGGRLAEILRDRVFTVSAATAAAAGASPSQVDFAVEIRARDGALLVGGLYLERGAAGVRDVAPIQPVLVRLPSRRGASASAGAQEAAPTEPERREPFDWWPASRADEDRGRAGSGGRSIRPFGPRPDPVADEADAAPSGAPAPDEPAAAGDAPGDDDRP